MVKSSPNFIITLTREIKVYSDGSGDLDCLNVDELKEIVIALKHKELNNYIAKNKADVFVQNLYEDIDDLPFKDNRDMVMLDKVGKYFKL
jgi:hypothetical protein